MKKTKLLQTLCVLTPSELREWMAFLNAPSIHPRPDVLLLATMLANQNALMANNMPDKHAIFEQLYGSQTAYDERKLNNTISDVYALLLDFLAAKHHQNNRLQVQADKVAALLARHLDKHAAQEHQKWHLMLQQHQPKDAAWARLNTLWWEIQDLLQHRQARRPTESYLHQQADAMLQTHQLDKMRLSIAALSRGALSINTDQQTPAWFQQLHTLPEAGSLHQYSTGAALYAAALRLLQEPSEHHFRHLTHALETHPKALTLEDRLALYQCAINYCIRCINDGKPEAYADILTLYKQLIDNQLLLQNGKLSQWAYKNIATAGLRTGEFAWTEQFLKSHNQFLPEADRESALAFNLASLYFETGAFAHALRTLQGVNFKDITYHLGAKILQMKIFFITNEFDTLASLLAATRRLIRRTRGLSPFGKTTNLNFLNVIQQLANISEKNTTKKKITEERSLLNHKIQLMHPLANKDWLLKMTELP
jgi:hypothetical protein